MYHLLIFLEISYHVSVFSVFLEMHFLATQEDLRKIKSSSIELLEKMKTKLKYLLNYFDSIL